MTKAGKTILSQIKNSNGLTNAAVACNDTKYKFSTCKRYFREFLSKGIIRTEKACDNTNMYFVV